MHNARYTGNYRGRIIGTRFEPPRAYALRDAARDNKSCAGATSKFPRFACVADWQCRRREIPPRGGGGEGEGDVAGTSI